MKIGTANYCPKKLNRILKNKQAEIYFLKEFLKNFETLRPHRRLPIGEDKQPLLAFLERNYGFSLERKLGLISLSKSKFYNWKNE